VSQAKYDTNMSSFMQPYTSAKSTEKIVSIRDTTRQPLMAQKDLQVVVKVSEGRKQDYQATNAWGGPTAGVGYEVSMKRERMKQLFKRGRTRLQDSSLSQSLSKNNPTWLTQQRESLAAKSAMRVSGSKQKINASVY